MAPWTYINNAKYRKGVGIIIRNKSGQLFMGKRFDIASEHSWQFPQGGTDQNEEYDAAALRELHEETGITSTSVQLLAKSPNMLTYDLPDHLQANFWEGKFKGQAQFWYVFQFTGKDSEINLTVHEQEFEQWKWDSFDFIANNIVPFKQDMYEQLGQLFQRWIM